MKASGKESIKLRAKRRKIGKELNYKKEEDQ